MTFESMLKKVIIPDANIFAKLLHSEPDSSEARMFFKVCTTTNTKLLVPELFKYEIAQITQYYKQPLTKTLDVFDAHEQSILIVLSPDRKTWLLAEEMVKNGHKKAGFPSVYDSIYHAIAIKLEAMFLTADKKHYAKTKQYGHIKLLKDWEGIFTEAKA